MHISILSFLFFSRAGPHFSLTVYVCVCVCLSLALALALSLPRSLSLTRVLAALIFAPCCSRARSGSVAVYSKEANKHCFFFSFPGPHGSGISDTKWAWSGRQSVDAARSADAAAAAARTPSGGAAGSSACRATGRCVWCAGPAARCVWCGPSGSAGPRAPGGVLR
jgi:hypothetical protein